MGCWWYRLDGEDRVVEVGPGWDEFAEENQAPAARAERVIGRPLAEFIDGAQTRALLRLLMARVRETGEVVEMPFRCDAPSVRRFMALTATADADGSVRVETRLLAAGERPSVDLLDRRGRAVGGTDQVRMCSWCNRIQAGPELWLEAETAVGRLGLFLGRNVPEITHGICPACQAGVSGGALDDEGVPAGGACGIEGAPGVGPVTSEGGSAP